MNQAHFIAEYNNKYREKFNPILFERDEDEIIEELKKIILSCQRDKFFTIKVLSFRTVEDYAEINQILYNYEKTSGLKSKNKIKGNKDSDNIYEYINLKDSDIKLLIVKYLFRVKRKPNEDGTEPITKFDEEIVDCIIAVPRVVDKFYFRLNGNVYSTMYQIADSSTYNNNGTAKKHCSITMKTTFQPVRIYKEELTKEKDLIYTTTGESKKIINFTSSIFKKKTNAFDYLFAKMGLYDTIRFMNFGSAVFITDSYIENDNMYTFNMFEKVYISTPKYLFDNDRVLQSFIYTIMKSITKKTNIQKIFSREYWLENLGKAFSSTSGFEKGESVLDSLEGIYDIKIKEDIHLPEDYKKTIYHILRWMICEFDSLYAKDNVNITIKKIRNPEFIASLYSMVLANKIHRISDGWKTMDINKLKKNIITKPMCLIDEVQNCQLVNYRNMVNDKDAMIALKFTYKGESGLGNKSGNSIPNNYRLVDKSHLGIIDPDSSSATDPGVTGTICPLVVIQDDKHFSEFSEPNNWDAEFAKTMSTYKQIVGLKEAIIAKDKMLGIKPSSEHLDMLNDSIRSVTELMRPLVYNVDHEQIQTVSVEIPLEEGGIIVYECN